MLTRFDTTTQIDSHYECAKPLRRLKVGSTPVAEVHDDLPIPSVQLDNPSRPGNQCTGYMLVNSFYASASDPCGISVFNGHLRQALARHGLDLQETNLRTAAATARTPLSILHYVPSGFASPEASVALIRLLLSRDKDDKTFVILHGLHKYGENRLLGDTPCPDQEQHIRAMLQTAESITALSESAAETCRVWQERCGGPARLLRLDHPGLFEPTTPATSRGSYALLGGISRSKKSHTKNSIVSLLELCSRQGVRVWEHWTNLPASALTSPAWKSTHGLLGDAEWSGMVSGALVVLCPYETRIQSVSGLISEALSAHRIVLSTSFDLALEMKRRVPSLVAIEDNLLLWPDLIRDLPLSIDTATAGIPTWKAFAASFAKELASTSHQPAQPGRHVR